MAALTAGHMENTRLLVTWCHYNPLRGTEFGRLHPRHMDVSRQRVGRHSEPSLKPGQKARQRMRDGRAVNDTPLRRLKRTAAFCGPFDNGVDTVEQESPPVGRSGRNP